MVIIIKCLAYWRGRSFFFTTRELQMTVFIVLNEISLDFKTICAPETQLEHWNFRQSECLIRIDLFLYALLIKKLFSFEYNETNDSQFF